MSTEKSGAKESSAPATPYAAETIILITKALPSYGYRFQESPTP